MGKGAESSTESSESNSLSLDDLDYDPKEVLTKIRSSFDDLVLYNDQGLPTIDINKLVYKPKHIKQEKEQEKLRWYLPDYIFCTFNFLALTYATYFLLNGLTIISWRNGMQSFVVGNCSEPSLKNVCDTIVKQYGKEGKDWNPYTIIRFFGPKDVSIHGLGLLICGIGNLLNVIVAINGCLVGSRRLLVYHLVIDVILFIFEVCLVTILKLTGRCDNRDREVIKVFLERYLDHYTRVVPDPERNETEDNIYLRNMVKIDMMEFDLLQISLTCCGVGNWTDFLPRSTWTEDGQLESAAVVKRYNLDKTEMVIPSTCCRQWWVRNIYCAHEAHMWAYPTVTDFEAHQFRQRVSQWGCLPKLVGLCKNMVVMSGSGGIVAWGIHFFLSVFRHISAVLQIQTIDALVLEKKRIFRNKEKDFSDQITKETGGHENVYPSASDLFSQLSQRDVEGKRPQIPPPPKDKDIAAMKSRRDFNRMKDSMKSTHLEDWVATGRAFVEESRAGIKQKNKEMPAAQKMTSSENLRRRKKGMPTESVPKQKGKK